MGHIHTLVLTREWIAMLEKMWLGIPNKSSILSYYIPIKLEGKFQYFSDARMWTQCTPQKLDIVCAVSSLYLNNLAS